jgi:hypothetical protein
MSIQTKLTYADYGTLTSIRSCNWCSIKESIARQCAPTQSRWPTRLIQMRIWIVFGRVFRHDPLNNRSGSALAVQWVAFDPQKPGSLRCSAINSVLS